MVDLAVEVNDTIDQILDYYQQEDMLNDLIDQIQHKPVCLDIKGKPFKVYVSTHKDLVAIAQNYTSKIIYGNDDFASDLVDAVFWVTIVSPTGEDHILVTHAYIATGEAA